MADQGESGGNMAGPNNPSGHFTPSFPTPATIGVQASQALLQENQCEPSIGAMAPRLGHPTAADTLVPPAMAAQAFHFQLESQQPHMPTMPQAGAPNAMPFQHFSGTAAVLPLPGEELAARVAAIDTLPSSQLFQHNNYAHGWYQAQPSPQQQPPLPPPPQNAAHVLQRPMAAMAPNSNRAAPPAAADGYGATSWARPMLPPPDWPGSWAPPAQQRPGMPAASPARAASGSAQPQPPRMTGKKNFEEFLQEAGVLDQEALDKIYLDELAEEMLADEQAGLGPVERGDRWVSLGDVLLSLGAVSSASGAAAPSTRQDQVRPPVQAALEAGAGATSGRSGDDEAAAAAAEARERRSRRMAMRKEAAARHHRRPDKHAAPRGSRNGPGAM